MLLIIATAAPQFELMSIVMKPFGLSQLPSDISVLLEYGLNSVMTMVIIIIDLIIMLIERGNVPAIGISLFRSLPNTGQAQSPESSALLSRAGAERIAQLYQAVGRKGYAEDVCTAGF